MLYWSQTCFGVWDITFVHCYNPKLDPTCWSILSLLIYWLLSQLRVIVSCPLLYVGLIFCSFILTTMIHSVVATTRRNGTRSMLTSAKLTEGYLVVGFTRELDKEPSLHCSSIYISYMWSVLQQYVYLMSYYSSTCVFHKATMLPTCALTSYL